MIDDGQSCVLPERRKPNVCHINRWVVLSRLAHRRSHFPKFTLLLHHKVNCESH